MPSVLVAAMVLLLLLLALGLILGFTRLVRAEAEKVRATSGRAATSRDA
jgi:hypothetical protein